MPQLALCNFIPEPTALRAFAREHGFSGIDWSFDINELPETPMQQSRWVKTVAALSPLEVRYHCPFSQVDLGHHHTAEAKKANDLFRRIIRLVSKAGGKYLTIHIGLGHDSTEPLSWDTTIANLRDMVRYGADQGITLCLENLAWGWTSKPNLFEKLIRRSGAAVTLDIGHAHACESVQSQQFAVEDFISPHKGNIANAHIYHTERSGQGHIAPTRLQQIQTRLDLLNQYGCDWWVVEIREYEGLLKAKEVVDQYLAGLDASASCTPAGKYSGC